MRIQFLLFSIALVVAATIPLDASGQDRCRILCAPSLEIAPSVTFTNLVRAPPVRDLNTGEVEQLKSEAEFEIFVAMGIPTEIPRVGLTFEAIWTPFVKSGENTFTGYTAEELGEEAIGENLVELETELNLFLVTAEETGGWVEAHFDIVDQLSPAAEPDDTRDYTHKLDLELDVAVAVFNWLPDGNWLRNIEAEASLDYLATGLPDAGDIVPKGERLWLEDASPWSLTLSVIIPLAPL
jgi:hypothetical protein